MKKIFLAFQLALLTGGFAVQAQNMYKLGGSWINLDNYSKQDTSTAVPKENDFKQTSKFSGRFEVLDFTTSNTGSAVYNEKSFRALDDNHIGITPLTAGGHEMKLMTNSNDQTLEQVPGRHFIIGTYDGVVNVQRFEGPTGYRVSKYDEFGKCGLKQNIPHTMKVEKEGKEIEEAYLQYFTHTKRFLVFSSQNSRLVHKSVVVDLKDGKMLPMEWTICGVVRGPEDVALRGYLLRDEEKKMIKVNLQGASWMLKEGNIYKVNCETIWSDSVLVIARRYAPNPGINLSAYNAKTGKPLWTADIKPTATAPSAIYLSMYNNKILMESRHGEAGDLQIFDIANGKQLFTTL